MKTVKGENMRIENYPAPAYWASALVNGDYSGLDDTDRTALAQWLADNGLSRAACLTCSDDAYIARFNGMITEMLDYTFPARA